MFLKISVILALALQISALPIEDPIYHGESLADGVEHGKSLDDGVEHGEPLDDGVYHGDMDLDEPFKHNPPGLFQGDMKLTEEQEEEMRIGSFMVNSDTRRHWPRNAQGLVVIAYQFDPNARYSADQQNWMVAQLRQIEAGTCVRFVVRTNQADWVRIGAYQGCWSFVGRVGGRQDLSMDHGCLGGTLMIHEMLHAMAHHHMQSSHDHNNFITIWLANVAPANHHIFNHVPHPQWNRFNTNYDFRSTVHYGRRAFSNNGRDTITTHDPAWIDIIGRSTRISAGDTNRVNRQYQCS